MNRGPPYIGYQKNKQNGKITQKRSPDFDGKILGKMKKDLAAEINPPTVLFVLVSYINFCEKCIHKSTTLPETNMEPEVLPSQKESCGNVNREIKHVQFLGVPAF